MAKPHAGGNTQRPSSGRSANTAAASAGTSAGLSPSDTTLPTPTSIPRTDLSSSGTKASANRSSVGSSSSASATDLPAPAAREIASIVKDVAKCLGYGDDSAFPTTASMLQQVLAPEGLADPTLLLELPDPEEVSSSTVVSASPANEMTASADSTVTQVAAPGESTPDAEGPLLTEMEHVLAELRGARGLSLRSKRLLTTLVQVTDAELNATNLRMSRAAFWSKVRIGILAATVFSVAAMDVALAVALFARRENGRYHHMLPPT